MPINKRIRRRLILLCTLTLLLTIGLVAGFFYAKWNRERQVEFAAQQGMAAYEAGDYLSALPKLSKAVSDDRRKNDLELVLALGQSRLRNIDPNGRHIRASEKFFLHALSIDPDNTEALEELVDIYIATGDTANVLSYSERLPEDDIELIKKRAGSLRAAGRIDDAIEEVRRIRELAPSDVLWPLYEFTLYGQRGDDIEDRIEMALEHARNHPDNQGVMAVLISLYRERGRFDDARDIVQSMIEMPDIDPDVIMLLMQQAESLDLAEESQLILDRVRARAGTSPELTRAMLVRLWRRSNYAEGLELALEAADEFENDITFLREAAGFATLSEGDVDVEPVYERFLEESNRKDTARGRIDEMVVDAYRMRSAGESVDLRTGIDAISRIEELSGGDKTLRMIKAEWLQRTGQADAALGLYRSLFEQTNSRSAGRQLSRLLLQMNQPEDSLVRAIQLYQNYPNLDSLLIRARAWIAVKRTGQDVYLIDRSLDEGGLITEKILEAYVRTKDLLPKSAPSILPYLAEASELEMQEETLAFALEEALGSEHVSARDLLLLIEIDERTGGETGSALLERAVERGATAFDTDFIMAQQARSRGEEAAALEIMRELKTTRHESDEQKTIALRRILGFLAQSSERDNLLGMIREVFGELPSDSASARIICSYPDIWDQDPELSQSALDQLERLLGTESNSYRIAKARKITSLKLDDESERAEAIVALNDVIKDSPGSVEAMLLLSEMLRTGKNPDLSAAVNYLRKAVDTQPNQVTLYPALIELLQMTGDRERSVRYLEKYQQLASDSDAARKRVALFMTQGDLPNAIEELRSIAEDSDQALDRISLGMFLARLGRVDEALVEYEKALELEPDNQFAFNGKVILYAGSDRVSEALEIVRTSDQIESGRKLALMVEIHNTASDRDAAMKACDELIDAHPDRPGSWIMQGRMRAAGRDFAGARNAYRQALELDPDNAVALSQLMPLLVADVSTWEEARLLIPGFMDDNPVLARVLELKMDSSDPSNGEFMPDSKDLERSIELVKRHPRALATHHLAWTMHTAAGLHGEALSVADRAADMIPTETSPDIWGFESALATGNWEAAMRFAKSAKEKVPMGRRLQQDLRIADLALRTGQTGEAVAALTKYEPIIDDDDAIRDNVPPGLLSEARRKALPIMLRSLMLQGLLKSGRAAKAWELVGAEVTKRPALFRLWMTMIGDLDEVNARDALDQITSHLEKTPDGRIQIVNSLIRISRSSDGEPDFLEAANRLDALEEEHPDSIRDIMLSRAQIAEFNEDLPRSMELHQMVIDSYSEDELEVIASIDELSAEEAMSAGKGRLILVTALNNLAFQHAESSDPEDHQEGIELIDRAIALSPPAMTDELRDTRAVIMIAQGRNEEALREMTLAMEAAPERLAYRTRTIGLLRDLGRLPEARSLGEESRKLIRSTRERSEEIQKLNDMIEEIN